MESAEPWHALDDLPHHLTDAILHFAGSLVGEGHGKNFRWLRPTEVENVRDAGRENARLAGSGAGKDQYWTIESFHCLALLRVEVAEVGRSPGAKCARGDAAGNRLRAQWSRVV